MAHLWYVLHMRSHSLNMHMNLASGARGLNFTNEVIVAWLTHEDVACNLKYYMDPVARKPVFRVFVKARLKPVSSTTETS